MSGEARGVLSVVLLVVVGMLASFVIGLIIRWWDERGPGE
jgi:hypothetical protein